MQKKKKKRLAPYSIDMKMKINYFTSFVRKTNYSRSNFIINKIFHRLNLVTSNSFFIQLTYLLTLSFAGYLALSLFSKPRSFRPHEFDLFFTSVSASTLSSMSTVEMETFSNFQLTILIVLMFLGGEVFTSFLGIQFQKLKFQNPPNPNISELNLIESNDIVSRVDLENHRNLETDTICTLKLNSMAYLGYVVLGYLLVVHICGSLFVYTYVSVFSSARHVLKAKGIKLTTFSVFAIVSSFSNCGFIPTNENMIVFKKNSGLLLTLISQILLGNTLYPVFLRFVISIFGKITKRREFMYLMESNSEIGYDHLLSESKLSLLALTSLGFVSVQFALFCAMEWNSKAMKGLSLYKKCVASMFQVVNSRHAGESVLDISLISPAILVVFVVMMYLPPYTLFQPKKDSQEDKFSTNDNTKRRKLLECLMFSNLSYLAIFVVLICISERENMKNDPLNFNVLNVVIEVISAYGNVGFSTGYSCERRLNRESECTDMWYGFSGKWSSMGKLILIIVMLFGRLNKFNMKGGKAWKLV